MAKLLIKLLHKYDHPEHFDDIIREYRSSERYIPSKIQDVLYELAGHKCSICNAPWLELHHIIPLEKGGKTEYENLIVLCPNCHTRVHKDNVPNPKQLRHYKLKQEIAYELPILSQISKQEREFLAPLIYLPFEDQTTFSKAFNFVIHPTEGGRDSDLATQKARKKLCFFYIEANGIISSSVTSIILSSNGQDFNIVFEVRLTSKGIKWLKYLKETGRAAFFSSSNPTNI